MPLPGDLMRPRLLRPSTARGRRRRTREVAADRLAGAAPARSRASRWRRRAGRTTATARAARAATRSCSSAVRARQCQSRAVSRARSISSPGRRAPSSSGMSTSHSRSNGTVVGRQLRRARAPRASIPSAFAGPDRLDHERIVGAGGQHRQSDADGGGELASLPDRLTAAAKPRARHVLRLDDAAVGSGVVAQAIVASANAGDSRSSRATGTPCGDQMPLPPHAGP